jgi:ATP-dependent Clp protease ATP-binding subunit ClpC
MYQRFTDEAKRAIYFSAQRAAFESAPVIDSTHLLLGLLTDDNPRLERIFHLRELLPQEATEQFAWRDQNAGNRCELEFQQTSGPASTKVKMALNQIRLGSEGKQILASAVREANRLRDYWIDVEHLVLGVLQNRESAAARRLHEVGLDIERSRKCVIESMGSRPPRPNPVLWWARRRPLGVALSVAFALGIIAALYFFSFIGAR